MLAERVWLVMRLFVQSRKRKSAISNCREAGFLTIWSVRNSIKPLVALSSPAPTLTTPPGSQSTATRNDAARLPPP